MLYEVITALKTYPGYVKDYKAAASVYSPLRAMGAISLIRSYDMKAKGFGDSGS